MEMARTGDSFQTVAVVIHRFKRKKEERADGKSKKIDE